MEPHGSDEAEFIHGLRNSSGWWFGTWFLFFHDILGKFIPTDFHIFQRGGSTTNQYGLSMDTSVLAYH
jgi:hypothetical protein